MIGTTKKKPAKKPAKKAAKAEPKYIGIIMYETKFGTDAILCRTDWYEVLPIKRLPVI